MKNSSIVNSILEIMEKEHLNLFHSISKEEILVHKNKIDWDNLSPFQFDYEMSKLFAMFKDAHTRYNIPRITTDKSFLIENDKIYIKNNDKFEEIISINDILSSKIINLAKNMTSWETKAWARAQIEDCLNNLYFYKLIGLEIENKVLCKTASGTEIVLSKYEKQSSASKPKPKPWYSYEIINNILYVKYEKCQDMPNYPFSHMVKEIEHETKDIKLSGYILDVRNNTGGHSEILNPLQKLFKAQKLQGAVLMNYRTFSSGRWAVARFKRDLNATLIGEATGGSAKSYGNNKHLEFADKKFSVSTKFFDFSDLGYTQSFLPDIEVKNTVKDIENKKDKVLETALTFLSKTKITQQDLINKL